MLITKREINIRNKILEKKMRREYKWIQIKERMKEKSRV